MKICFIVGAFPTMKCGVGDYTYNLVSELAEENNEVSVITSEKAQNSNDKFKIYNIIKSWNFRSLNDIIKQIKTINPDVVHIQYPSDEYKKNMMINFLPLIIKLKCKCKVVATIHEYSIGSKLGKIRNFISMKLSDETVVVEERYIGDINKDFKVFSKKLKINYVPIFSNIPKYNMNETELSNLKTELGLNDFKVISYFGFINKNKGFEDIIEVLKKFKANKEKVKCLFVGEFNKTDEYHNELIKQLETNDLMDYIKITGFVESAQMVANYLRISDVCMLPFKTGVSERNGSFLAACKQDIPVLTTTCDEGKVQDDIYYEKLGNIDSQYNTLQSIFNNSNKVINREEKNSVTYVAKKHLEIYNKI